MKTDGQQKVGVIIAAAGESRRMGGVDKIFALLDGKPVLAWVVDVFQRCNLVDQIVVVLSEQNLKRGQQLVAEQRWSKVSYVCAGGKRRRDSVTAGLKHLNNCDWVAIHDGARPVITVDLISHGLEAAKETGAAVAAVPVVDTIKLAADDRIVHQTLPRQNLWAIQTPQVFHIEIITKAYSQANGDVTDDASSVEQLGYRVKIYVGSYDNIKITTPEDLAFVEWMLYNRKGRPQK